MYRIAFSRMALADKIPAGSALWPKFNASFDNRELEPIEIANEIYTGHAFTTWHRNHWRDTSNYELGQHIGLDFDTSDKRSTLAHLAAEPFIARYAAMIYTTPSHTPEAPRARVLFLLDTPIYQATNYVLAAQAMTWLFSHADPKCKDAARFFYGCRNCQVEYIDHVLPLDVVRGIIRKWQATGASEKRRQVRQEDNLDAARLVTAAIDKAAYGERNSLGFWLACRLAEAGMPQTEAERYMLDYQRAVQARGRADYTEHEALASVRSAYRTA